MANNTSTTQSDLMIESTLESEIDALSKIITDTKDNIKKSEDSDSDFKLGSDDLNFNDSLECDSLDKDQSELLCKNNFDKLQNCSSTSNKKSNIKERQIKSFKLNPSTQKNIIKNLNKDGMNDSDVFLSFQNTKNNYKITNELETKFQKVNFNLPLINEFSNLQNSQGHSQNQQTSILKNKNIESINVSECNEIKSFANISSAAQDFNTNEIQVNLPMLSSKMTNETDVLQTKLDNITNENISKQNKSDVSDFIKSINIQEQDDFTFKNNNLNNFEKINDIKGNVTETNLKLDDFNKSKETDVHQLVIENVDKFGVDKKNNDLHLDRINNKDELKVLHDSNEIQKENKVKDLLNNHDNNVKESTDKIPVQSIELNIGNFQLKDTLAIEKMELINLFQSTKEIDGSSELLNMSNNSDIISEINKLKSTEEFLKYENIDGNIKTIEEKATNINIADSTVENKNVRICDVIHFDPNIKFFTKSKEKKIEGLQDNNLNNKTLQVEDTVKKIDCVESTEKNIRIECLQEISQSVNDVIQNNETMDSIEFSENIKMLKNSERVTDFNYLQECKINHIKISLENTDNENFQNRVLKQNSKSEIELNKITTKDIKIEEQFFNETKCANKNNIQNKKQIETTKNETNENKNIDCENNSFTNLISQNKEDFNKHPHKIDKDLLEFKNIKDQIIQTENNKMRQADKTLDETNLTINEKIIKKVSLIGENTCNDFDKKSELEKSVILDKMNLQEIQEQKILKSENDLEASVTIGISEQKIENYNNEITNNDEKRIENIKYIEFDECNLEILKSMKLNTLTDINFDENLDLYKKSAVSITEEADLEKNSDIRQKSLNSGSKNFFKIEYNMKKEILNFIDVKKLNIPIQGMQLFDKKLEDNSSIIDDTSKQQKLKLELIKNKEDIHSIYEKCNHTFNQGQKENKKFNESYSTGSLDTTENNASKLYNIKTFDKGNNIKSEKKLNIFIKSELSENTNKNVQLEMLKKELNFVENKQIVNKLSENSEIESSFKFLKESEEKYKLKDVAIGEENSSRIILVDNSINHNVSEIKPNLQVTCNASLLKKEKDEKLGFEQQFNKQFTIKPFDPESTNIEVTGEVQSDNVLSDVAKEVNCIPDIPNDKLKISITTKEAWAEDSLINTSFLKEHKKNVQKHELPEFYTNNCDFSKTSLLINKEYKQKLDNIDAITKNNDIKASDAIKKDFDKQCQQYSETENVSSPRIILKIAKSAITECSEPRSPKSPKIRSAANSPNPEDTSGQKLGKIKLKLSKDGHPSIIPNTDIYDESVQWYTDNTSSLGMRIKLTKSGDNTVVENKFEEIQKQDELKFHKNEEIKKIETSIGMKIKLSKGRDALIAHQDITAKDNINQDISIIKKQDSPPIGMKIKLSKFGDAAIIQQDNNSQFNDETVSKLKDKIVEDNMKRSDLSTGMKMKLSKCGDVSVINNESVKLDQQLLESRDMLDDSSKRIDSTIGVKIKLAKMKDGGASIVSNKCTEEVIDKHQIIECLKNNKFLKKKETSEITDTNETIDTDSAKPQEISKVKMLKVMDNKNIVDSSVDQLGEIPKTCIGKIKLLKNVSIMHTSNEVLFFDATKKINDQIISTKIKHSKNIDSALVNSDISKQTEDSLLCIKVKHSKSNEVSLSNQQKSKDDVDNKLKLIKVNGPIIISNNEMKGDSHTDLTQTCSQKDPKFKESAIKTVNKTQSELNESIKSQVIENAVIDLHSKRKEITVSPIELKKCKIEADLTETLPDVTIQPISSGAINEKSHQKILIEHNSKIISKQQMNVINREISITQICSSTNSDTMLTEQLKGNFHDQNQPLVSSPLHSDCEIIEPQPELIIVNENSNSSQDIMIIDEVPSTKSLMKIPKKRGRPRRNATIVTNDSISISNLQELELQRDPLCLEQFPMPITMPMAHYQIPMLQEQLQTQISTNNAEGIERPRRTCRSQKSYAPPKRGRGRGRGKRKTETNNIPFKRQRIQQDLTAIEKATTTFITSDSFDSNRNGNNSLEFFKALNESTLQLIDKQLKEGEILETAKSAETFICKEKEHQHDIDNIVIEKVDSHNVNTTTLIVTNNKDHKEDFSNKSKIMVIKNTKDKEKRCGSNREQKEIIEHKDALITQDHQNWLAPTIKKVLNECGTKSESIQCSLAVIDEETRMSAESNFRSQTPARSINISGTTETLINEESQGSVLSTATTESEKVKVKNRRMEISFDPDEGPFTVEKIAEYEWPLQKRDDKMAGRGETFMIQEQISQYLGVKSFKRKYPDLKRRVVDMEERNFLRENALVNESMCDMGLTAISSSEVLDIMCSDFPEQYEEYRKHMREKAAKEHSKKQKELSATANAERNRIDLAEMAIQSAISWNSCLNKARQDSRKFSLDLQTFTIHMPKQPMKLNTTINNNHYPIALIPGQFTDYYRKYTPAELRYYPLNTVLYGPMRPNERKFDSQSDGSQSDSDSDSSSDDSSSSSSDGTQDTEGSQSMIDEVDTEVTIQPDIKCKMCLTSFKKSNQTEPLINCGTCSGNG